MDDRAADGLHALGRLHAEIPASGQICQREHAGQMPVLHGNGRLAALVVLTALCNTVLYNVVQLDSGWSMILSTLGCAALGSFFVTPNATGEENSHAEP